MMDPTTSTMTATRDTLLISSVIHLMSHYCTSAGKEAPCVKLASSIQHHLAALSRCSDLDPVVRATCEGLVANWSDVVETGVADTGKRSLVARLLDVDGFRKK
jgi:hypothetical protein